MNSSSKRRFAVVTGASSGIGYELANLATYDSVEMLYDKILATGRSVDAIALNAGVGVGGEFTKTDLQAELNLIELNVASTIHLAKRVVKDIS